MIRQKYIYDYIDIQIDTLKTNICTYNKDRYYPTFTLMFKLAKKKVNSDFLITQTHSFYVMF